MAIKLSGPLSFSTDIVGEFEDTAPHSISEFYDGAGLVPTGANPNVPSSGAVSFSNFYGAVNVVTISIINNQYDSNGTLVTLDKASTLNLFEIANKTIGSNAGNNVVVPLVFRLDSDTVFNNSIIFGGSFTDITIENNGIIAGRGGHGFPRVTTKTDVGENTGQGAGNTAIFIDSDQTKVTINNLSKGFIGAGGDERANGSSATNTAPRETGSFNSFAGPSVADATAGRGGGWNGGNGGQGRAAADAEIGGDNVPDRDVGAGTFTSSGGVGAVVTSRNATGQGGSGSVTATADAWARINDFRDNLIGMSVSASATSGGSGLSSGSMGNAGASAQVSYNLSTPESRALAKGVSGSGGGGGINGGPDAPYFRSTASSGSGAGGNNSIQIKSTSTVSTSSMINSGKVYGDTDIAIS